MRYQELQPRPELAPFVECIWTLEEDAGILPGRPDPILPDGCIELILNFGSPFHEHLEDGARQLQPLRLLVGQMTRPIFIAPTGNFQLIGIRFHPGGAHPFFRLSMDEITDTIVELGAVESSLERDLVAAASSHHSVAAKVAAIQATLIKRTEQFRDDSWIRGLVSSVIVSGGRESIDQLAANAGVTGRQLQRRFLREVGVGPKLLSRILRFQQVFRAVEREQEGWADVAASCGYYDQAHLIKDFQQFAHQTPAVLLAHTSPLTESFTRKRRVSHFSNTLD